MFNYIGIDVSKATLQVYIPITDENISIENSKKALISLYSKLKKYYKKEIKNLVIIFEPTGSYSSLLKRFCFEKNIYAFIINPRQSANFAKALENRSKSDIIDAKMLYKFHVMLSDDDIAIPIIDSVQEEEIKVVTIMKLLVLSDDSMKQKFENISSIVGIGDKAAIVLMHLFMTYPEANRQEINALSGLDAIENTSGTSIQRRTRISKKGSSIYRSVLFMAVLSSIQHNQYMKRFYERLKDNGKHSTVAQIAVMRKMILIAHSLFKNNVKFSDSTYEKNIGIL